MIQVGSRVRFMEVNNFGLVRGNEYVVTELSESGTYLRVAEQNNRTRLNVRYFEEVVEPPAPPPPPPEPPANTRGLRLTDVYGCCAAHTMYFGSRMELHIRDLEAFQADPNVYDFEGDPGDGEYRNIIVGFLNDQQMQTNMPAALEAHGYTKVGEGRSNHGGLIHIFVRGLVNQQPVVENERQF